MKIALVFDTMVYGGIERVGINYAKLFKEMGYEVDAYVLNGKTEDIIEDLKKYCPVSIINFGRAKCPEAYWSIAKKKRGGKLIFPIAYYGCKVCLPLFRHRYRSKKTYDLAIAFSGHFNDLTYVAFDFIKAKKKVAWLHGAQFEYRILSPGYETLYAKIRNLVCLSELCDGECIVFNKENDIKKYKIYNPIEIAARKVDTKIVSELREKYGDFCLMVARLSNDKDQKTAIKAMKYLKEEYHIEKKLVLVGDGPNRRELEQLVESEQMKNQIVFMGTCNNVQDYYAAASVYVHSSPLEGLPTVLLEAMSFQLPIAATDSIPGVREILGDQEYGLISPIQDEKQLAENIRKLYEDEELRKVLIKREEERIKDFSSNEIKKKVKSLINDMMGE